MVIECVIEQLWTALENAQEILEELSAFYSGELRNGALRIWRGGVCFSRSFTCRKNILDLIYTPHKDSFYNIINVFFLSRDLSHPFLSFYFNQNLHHFVNKLCNLIYLLSMTVGTGFVELIGAFLIYVRFANHSVFC